MLGDFDFPSNLESLAAMRSFFLCSSDGTLRESGGVKGLGGDGDELGIGITVGRVCGGVVTGGGGGGGGAMTLAGIEF